MKLVKQIYVVTKSFPPDERFGITAQIRRSSTSILANLAEGFSRKHDADKAYKYVIARGECSETLAFLLVAMELGYVEEHSAKPAITLTHETGKLLSGLIHRFSA